MKRLVRFRTDFESQIIFRDSENTDWMLTYDEGAYARGYACVTDMIAFFPIIKDGLCDITVWFGQPAPTAAFKKMAKARLSVPSGELHIHEPENPPLILWIAKGDYDVIFAQNETENDRFIEIDVFLIPCGVDAKHR